MSNNSKKSIYSASEIARYFLWKSGKENCLVSNKKLQKLLYYAQAWHLVFNNGEPLFHENIEAWIHGPVVRCVYDEFKKFGFNPISIESKENPINTEDVSLLEQIWKIYGGFDADYLEILTHQEKPWQIARQNVELNERSNSIIDQVVMTQFYKELLNETK